MKETEKINILGKVVELVGRGCVINGGLVLTPLPNGWSKTRLSSVSGFTKRVKI